MVLKNWLSVVGLFIISNLFLCAHQVTPSGGVVDIIPPVSVGTVPPEFSLGCKDLKKVTITFSEWIDRASAVNAVIFSPMPQGGVEIEVNGRVLVISPRSKLAENTTYHVEVNSLLKDIHGVALSSPHVLVFSTGEALDSGTLSGCLGATSNGKRGRYRISLYYADTIVTDEKLFESIPSYTTETDSFGVFTFTHIRKGNYRLVGLFGNSSLKNALGAQTVVAPTKKIVSTDSNAAPLVLFPVSAEFKKIRCSDFRLVDSYRGIATFSRNIPLTQTDPVKAERVRIVSLDSVGVSSVAVTKIERLPTTTQWLFTFDTALVKGSYRFIITHPDTILFSKADTIRFNGSPGLDTVQPIVRFGGSRSNVRLDTKIVFVANKLLSIVPQQVFAIDSLGDSVVCNLQMRGISDTVVYKPTHRLFTDKEYMVFAKADLFKDLSGNYAKADSLGMAFSVKMRTIPSVNLCNSLSGSAPCLEPSKFRQWIFTPLGFAQASYCADSASTFRFDSIPSSKGVLSYFDDLDGNGVPTAGTLFPFSAPEPLFTVKDTIEARARWDITGIVVPNCAGCNKTENKPHVKKQAQ